MALNPAQRKARARVAAHTRWAKPDARAHQSRTQAAAKVARYDALVDPEGTLDPEVRAIAARSLLRADMARLGRRSADMRTAASKAAR